jgi:hypothetical protein
MSKIDGDGNKPASLGSGAIHFKAGSHKEKEKKVELTAEVAAEGLSNVSLESNGSGKTAAMHHSKPPCPSLLSQQAPHDRPAVPPADQSLPRHSLMPSDPRADVPLSSSLMSVDSERVADMSSALDLEKITVKIADLGNGLFVFFPSSHPNLLLHSYMGRTSFYR